MLRVVDEDNNVFAMEARAKKIILTFCTYNILHAYYKDKIIDNIKLLVSKGVDIFVFRCSSDLNTKSLLGSVVLSTPISINFCLLTLHM